MPPADRIHLGVLAASWITGIVTMFYTIPRVSKLRRLTYYFAVPVWAVFAAMYLWATINYEPAPVTFIGVVVRVALGAVALEGILVPYVDRKEAELSTTTIQVVVQDGP